MSRLLAAQRALTAPGWVKEGLSRKAQALPSLDLHFAESKSLTDAASGQSLVTFTRASSGTYVGSDGLLKTATTNLLLQSEDLTTTWVATRSSVTANAAVAPTGTTTADKLTEDTTASNSHTIAQSGISYLSGQLYTFSVYAKASERSSIRMQYPSAAFGTNVAYRFDLIAGTATLLIAGTNDSASIVSAGNGWYRCSVTAQATVTSSGNAQVQLVSGETSIYTGDGISGLFLWGAQVEQSSTVGEYIPTTSTINSASRFDHNPTTGESLGLLVEESRANLLVQSNGFDTTWTNTNSTETATSGTAPDGTNTAWQLKDTVDVSAVAHSLNQSVTFTAATNYTFSVWGKAGTLDRMALVFPAALFANATARVLSITFSTGVTSTTGSPTSTTVTQFSNGWWLLSMTVTVDNGVAAAVSIRTAIAGGSSYQGDGNGTILVWGAQLEAGAFPTSYIPTTTATATRSADVASITGANFSSWYNQSEGTLYAEAQIGRQNAIAGAAICGIETGVQNAEALYLHYRGTGLTAAQIFDSLVLQMDQSPYGTAVAASTTTKHAFAVKLNDSVSAGGGTALTTDTVCTMPTPDRMLVGFSTVSSNYLSGVIRRLTYWPARLSNSTLQAITQ